MAKTELIIKGPIIYDTKAYGVVTSSELIFCPRPLITSIHTLQPPSDPPPITTTIVYNWSYPAYYTPFIFAPGDTCYIFNITTMTLTAQYVIDTITTDWSVPTNPVFTIVSNDTPLVLNDPTNLVISPINDLGDLWMSKYTFKSLYPTSITIGSTVNIFNIITNQLFATFKCTNLIETSSSPYYEYIIASAPTNYVIPYSPIDNLIMMNYSSLIADEYLELNDDIVIPITYSIADIQNISKTSSSFSLNITIPGTSHNNTILGHIANLNTDGGFVMNYPSSCYVLVDGINIFEGNFRISKVIKKGKSIDYEISLYSITKTFFNQMGDKLISNNATGGTGLSEDDIDFSDLNHTLDDSTIIASFGGTNGYVYAPIDKFGKVFKTTLKGTGTYYDYELTCSLSVQEVFDRIFDKYGFLYISDTLDLSNLFISNINKYQIYSQTEVKDSSSSLKTYEQLLINDPIAYVHNITSGVDVITDMYPVTPSTIYDATTGIFTIVTDSAYYDFNGILNFKYETIFTAESSQFGHTFAEDIVEVSTMQIMIYKSTDGGSTWSSIPLLSSAVDTQTPSSANNFYTVTAPSTTTPTSLPIVGYDEISISVNNNDPIFCHTGDLIKIMYAFNGKFRWYNGSLVDPALYSEINIKLLETSFFNLDLKPIVYNGGVVNVSQIFNTLKQSEFILGIIKMFNLYVEPIDNKTFKIEPRNTFYNTDFDAIINLDNKLDYNEDIWIEASSTLDEQDIIIKYNDTSDFYNDMYKNNYAATINLNKLNYGEYYKQGNSLSTDKLTIELPFGTSIVGPMGIDFGTNILGGNIINNYECPKMFACDAPGDDAEVKYEINNNKIFYYQGLVIPPTYLLNQVDKYFKILNDLDDSVIWFSDGYSGYPSLSTFDIPFGADEHSLDFGMNRKYWVNMGNSPGPTTNTLEKLYYDDMFIELLNTNSKLITCYIYFKVTDIVTNKTKFDKIYFVNGVKCRLNKIYNFVPNTICKCEFIKIP